MSWPRLPWRNTMRRCDSAPWQRKDRQGEAWSYWTSSTGACVAPDSSIRSPCTLSGIVASGWHTVGLAMRLYVDHYLSSVASLASPGVDELRWTHPVRPGDSLRI